MGWVGCYILHLYCDHQGCDEWIDVGGSPASKREAFKYGRELGWKIVEYADAKPKNGIGFALCPNHSGRKPAVVQPEGTKISEILGRYDGGKST